MKIDEKKFKYLLYRQNFDCYGFLESCFCPLDNSGKIFWLESYPIISTGSLSFCSVCLMKSNLYISEYPYLHYQVFFEILKKDVFIFFCAFQLKS